MVNEITCTVSKSGKNLNARIPDSAHNRIARGDKVEITIIEKAANINPKIVKREIRKFMEKPNGEKLKGQIIGYNVEIPLAKIIKTINKNEETEKMLFNAIMRI